ncbi:hypothetical protein P12x_003050 [Tundrisphaera lichenicola]|uniref:hypothetical protein n=1 Tax=Tundrisphaera lichenicola TaxID=2029860 RepID=UPI003EBBBC05
MAKSNVFMDFKEITVTYGSGTPTVLTLSEVTEMEVMIDDELAPWQADGNKYATLMVVASSMRGGKIMGGDVAALAGIPKGTYCTVQAKLYDAVNRDGAGCLTFAWTNAVFGSVQAAGQSNKFAGGSTSFMCIAPDGATSPLTITQS